MESENCHFSIFLQKAENTCSMMTLNESALLNGHIAKLGLRQMPCAHLLMDALCCYKYKYIYSSLYQD